MEAAAGSSGDSYKNIDSWAIHLRPSASEPLRLEYLYFT